MNRSELPARQGPTDASRPPDTAPSHGPAASPAASRTPDAAPGVSAVDGAAAFSYDEAFSRNLGWVTEAEQQKLRHSRVAIAGLGGVGGVYLLALARLGIGRFCIADFDSYALANFNRQFGAGMSTIGRPKLDVMVEMALEINPELEIRRFPAGVRPADFDAFLDGVDVYLDGLDFFALDVRAALFGRCERDRIPATTVAPLGMGAALLNFVPGRMSFEEYFGFEGHGPDERALRFLTGLSPSMLQLPYLVDPTRVDLAARRGPSTVVGVQLCAAVAAGQVLKLVLGRGDVVAAPAGLHFDIYRNRLKKTWRPGGHRHPVQRLMRRIARARLPSSASSGAPDDGAGPALDQDQAYAEVRRAGMLAPSADNRSASTPVRCADGVELQLPGVAADPQLHERWLQQVAAGAMAENMRLRAARLGHPLEVRSARPESTGRPGVCVRLVWSDSVAGSQEERELDAAIEARHTNRRFFNGRQAPSAVLDRIAAAAAGVRGARLVWCDAPDKRRRALAMIGAAEAERFRRDALHRELFGAIRFDVGWQASTDDGLPPGSLEVEPPLRPFFAALRRPAVMRIARWFGAAPLLGFRAAYLPARSAPHLAAIVVDADGSGGDADRAVAAGRALERAWLAATAAGLAVQPFAAVGAMLRMRSDPGWVSAALQNRLADDARRLLEVDRPETLQLFVRIGTARGRASVRTSRISTP